jgi:hypothetical protein
MMRIFPVVCMLLGMDVMPAFGAVKAPAANGLLEDNMTVVKSAIAHEAGFRLAGAGELHYVVNAAAPCHLSWKPVVTNNDGLQIAIPDVEADEDLGVIAKGSVTVQTITLADLIAADAGGAKYYKVVGRYIDAKDGDAVGKDATAFGILFSDKAAARDTANALNRAVALCGGPDAAALHVVPAVKSSQCSTVNDGVSLVKLTVKPDAREMMAGKADEIGFTFRNSNNFSLSCALHYSRNGRLDSDHLMVVEVKAHADGRSIDLQDPKRIDISGAADEPMQYRCYRVGAMDENGKACVSDKW